jgi:hypothetical protein
LSPMAGYAPLAAILFLRGVHHKREFPRTVPVLQQKLGWI